MLPELITGVQLNNGKILEEEKVNELTNYMINKFAEEKLSLEEAEIILGNIKDTIRECAVIQSTRDRSE